MIRGSISEGQSLNRYAYTSGNPVSYIDPFGLSRDGDGYGYGDGFNRRDFYSLGIGFIPGVGEGKSFIEIFTGRDLVSDRPVSKGEAIFGAIPVLGKLKKVALVGGFMGGGIKVINRADDAADMFRVLPLT